MAIGGRIFTGWGRGSRGEILILDGLSEVSLSFLSDGLLPPGTGEEHVVDASGKFELVEIDEDTVCDQEVEAEWFLTGESLVFNFDLLLWVGS